VRVVGLLLAAPAPDPDQVRPGVLGLLVVLGLVVATVFLLRSFTRQLRKIDFDESGQSKEDVPSEADAPIDDNRSG
jgi:hypothetical protein